MNVDDWGGWERGSTGSKETVELGSEVHDDWSIPEDAARATVWTAGHQGRIAHLVVKRGNPEGRAFQLGAAVSVGRSSGSNDIVLGGDDSVSRQHAQIRLEDGSFVFYNLSASYGSYLVAPLGRQRIEGRLVLRDGDELEIGERTVLAFRQSS